MAATNQFSSEASIAEAPAQEYEVMESVYEVQPQGVNTWAAGLAAMASVAFGALAFKVKSASKQIPSVAAIPTASLMAAQPAMAMQTNSQAPIATALFIFLPTFFLIILYVSTRANLDNQSGAFDQDYYDRSKAAGNKKTNEAARMRGAGLGMYAEKRNTKR
jgi:photosystem II PsbM protein